MTDNVTGLLDEVEENLATTYDAQEIMERLRTAVEGMEKDRDDACRDWHKACSERDELKLRLEGAKVETRKECAERLRNWSGMDEALDQLADDIENDTRLEAE